jgi:hypothetical protein
VLWVWGTALRPSSAAYDRVFMVLTQISDFTYASYNCVQPY